MLGRYPDEHLAEAEFTKDMVETMLQYFEAYADENGVMRIRVRLSGLWLEHPQSKSCQFLGLARLPTHLLQ